MPQGQKWSNDTDLIGQSTELLVYATWMLDNLYVWKGKRASDTQALSWPRGSVLHRETGAAFANNIIPDFIQRATLELAIHLYETDRANAGAQSAVTSFRLGPVTVQQNGGNAPAVPLSVNQLVAGYTIRNRHRSSRLVRA